VCRVSRGVSARPCPVLVWPPPSLAGPVAALRASHSAPAGCGHAVVLDTQVHTTHLGIARLAKVHFTFDTRVCLADWDPLRTVVAVGVCITVPRDACELCVCVTVVAGASFDHLNLMATYPLRHVLQLVPPLLCRSCRSVVISQCNPSKVHDCKDRLKDKSRGNKPRKK
jgi:hypothetical protein